MEPAVAFGATALGVDLPVFTGLCAVFTSARGSVRKCAPPVTSFSSWYANANTFTSGFESARRSPVLRAKSTTGARHRAGLHARSQSTQPALCGTH